MQAKPRNRLVKELPASAPETSHIRNAHSHFSRYDAVRICGRIILRAGHV
jgi:hypothetical protein